MRTRAAAALAMVSIGFGVASAILAGVAYVDVMEARAAVPVARVLRFFEASTPDATLPGYPALPDADHLPGTFTEQQREDATIWLQQQQYVDECMADAGYTEWFYFAPWQTGYVDGLQEKWLEGLDELERSAAFGVLMGDPGEVATAGITYRWEKHGCEGQAWHKVGIDYPIAY